MKNINTEQYWDGRFEHDWEAMQGKEQTTFFTNVAISLMPDWLTDEIRENHLSICDFGCAGGQAVDILHRYFHTTVIGADFSEKAVALAQRTYPDHRFIQNDILREPDTSIQVDISYLSNVLEHFDKPWEAASNAAAYASKYVMILIPFRETLQIEEHCSHFDLENIPLKIADMDLIFANYVDCAEMADNLYSNPQIFLLYGRKGHYCMNGLAEVFERKVREQLMQEEQKSERLFEQNGQLGEKIAMLNEQLAQQERKNQALTDQITILTDKNSELAEQLAQAEQRIQKQQKQSDHIRMEIEEALRCICTIQSKRAYRMGLLAQRFAVQCLKTRDKRDFARWFLKRLLRKNTSAKALREFDSLENVKLQLKKASQRQQPEDKKGIHKKKTKRVIIFAAVPFFDVGGGQRSAQLARAFHSLGYQVFYIYGFPCTEENIPDMFIPANEHRLIDEIDMDWFTSMADRQTMVIFEVPYRKFEPYLDKAKQAGCFTVYEHIDNWDTSLGCLFYEPDVFRSFLQKVDLITVTAKKLGEKIKEYCSRTYQYLPNAVNIEIFEPLRQYDRPSDLKRGRKTLLYFGSLWGEWFAWDKIDYLAEKCPDCEINLIGDYSGCMDRVKKKRKNVHFLGLKKQVDLPSYLKYTDYALLPFRNCEIGAYVSPLKIFEYIAMNVKVLATCLPDIKGYPNVFCSDSKEAWVRVIKEGTMELKDSHVFLSQNNWFARCAKLMEQSGIYHRKPVSMSVIVLNYNNSNVIRRCVDTLLAHNGRYGYEVIVVDNGSTDGSYELLEKEYSDRVLLLKNTKNGCSSGRNLGVRNAQGEYLCFLDSDQWVVSDHWLDSALDILETDTKIGAVGWAAGWFTPGKAAGPIVDYMYNRAIDSADIWYRTDIAYLGTGGLVMERRLFELTGGFDEFYDPTCFEDTDLSLEIRDAGYELAYCPYIGVMHLPHQTTQSGSRQHERLMKRNGEYFQAKWKERREELLEYYYG